MRAGISFCRVSGRLLFLDVPGDRYFCLDDAAERSFARLVGGDQLTSEDRQALDKLIAQGLLHPTDLATPPVPCVPPRAVDTSLLDIGRPPRAAGLAASFAAQARAATALRLRGLDAVLRRVARRKAALPAAPPPRDALEKVAGAFDRLALLATPLDRCLPRSVAVAHRLLDRGVPPDLVIGVKLHPFGAHCWVQHGGAVVNDRVDTVRAFTAILVI